MSATSTRAGTPALPRTPAVVAGSALLLMAALAVWAPLAVLEPVMTSVDPAVAVAASPGAVRAAAAAMLLVAVLDVVVAWALLHVLRPTDEPLARLAAWLRTAYGAGFAVAVAHVLVAVQVVEDVGATDAASNGVVARELQTFQAMWDVGLLLIGLHLLLVGAAVLRSPVFPRWLGALLVLAGAGYSVDALVVVLSPAPWWQVTTVTFVGEVALAVWLLVRAVPRRGGAPTG